MAIGKLPHTWLAALERVGNEKSKIFHPRAIFPGKASLPLPK